jgi:hypothetical protein
MMVYRCITIKSNDRKYYHQGLREDRVEEIVFALNDPDNPFLEYKTVQQIMVIQFTC